MTHSSKRTVAILYFWSLSDDKVMRDWSRVITSLERRKNCCKEKLKDAVYSVM